MAKNKRVLALLLTMLCAVVPMKGRSAQRYTGIDVSVWQGDIDYAAVRDAGIEAVYIRAGEGASITDEAFGRNYAGFHALGMPLGFYHFVTAKSEEQARVQARFFASLVEGKEYAFCLAADYGVAQEVSRETANAAMRAFLEEIESLTGRKAAIYSDAYGARTLWEDGLSVYPLWVADYAQQEPEKLGPWEDWAGWQYTNRGRVAGIHGDVDRDVFTDALLDGEGPLPTAQPTPQPTPAPVPTATPEGAIEYTLQRGDTLSRLAARYDTSVCLLVKINRITNANRIYAGDSIWIIPGKATEERMPEGEVYIAVRGDSLVRIAKRFGTSARVLAAYNGITDMRLIYIGEEIRIPAR